MDIQRLAARNLRRIRLKRGVSQEALALETGIDRAYVSRLESAAANPTIGLLDRIATVLRCTVADIVEPGAAREPAPKNLPRGRHVRRKASAKTARRQAPRG